MLIVKKNSYAVQIMFFNKYNYLFQYKIILAFHIKRASWYMFKHPSKCLNEEIACSYSQSILRRVRPSPPHARESKIFD